MANRRGLGIGTPRVMLWLPMCTSPSNGLKCEPSSPVLSSPSRPEPSIHNCVQTALAKSIDRAVRVEPRADRPCVLKRQRRTRTDAVVPALDPRRMTVPRDRLHPNLGQVLYCPARPVRACISMQRALNPLDLKPLPAP